MEVDILWIRSIELGIWQCCCCLRRDVIVDVGHGVMSSAGQGDDGRGALCHTWRVGPMSLDLRWIKTVDLIGATHISTQFNRQGL